MDIVDDWFFSQQSKTAGTANIQRSAILWVLKTDRPVGWEDAYTRLQSNSRVSRRDEKNAKREIKSEMRTRVNGRVLLETDLQLLINHLIGMGTFGASAQWFVIAGVASGARPSEWPEAVWADAYKTVLRIHTSKRKNHNANSKRVLGGELNDELQAIGTDGKWHSMLLQNLRYGRREIASVLQARLTEWLAGSGLALMRKSYDPTSEAKLDQVIRVLLTHGDSMSRRWIQELATWQVSAAKHGPYLFFWLPELFHLNPARGSALVLHLLDTLPVETNGIAVKVIGCLFNERRVEGKSDWSKVLNPDTLLRLTRAVYFHVSPEKDVKHEGVYSPDLRDNAENGRRYVFNTFIQATGTDAFQAKLELASDPMFAHAKDRIAHLHRSDSLKKPTPVW